MIRDLRKGLRYINSSAVSLLSSELKNEYKSSLEISLFCRNKCKFIKFDRCCGYYKERITLYMLKHVLKLTSIYLESPLRTNRHNTRKKSCSRKVRSITRISVCKAHLSGESLCCASSSAAFYRSKSFNERLTGSLSPTVDPSHPTSPHLPHPPFSSLPPSTAWLWREQGWTSVTRDSQRQRQRWAADAKTTRHLPWNCLICLVHSAH